MLTNEAEEILETLWIRLEEKAAGLVKLEHLGIKPDSQVLKELISAGAVETDGNSVKLTVQGKDEGKDIVRRHRLAERLFVDVLDLKEDLVNETACKFEHLLHEGIDDNICTLLGHPKLCPHGKPIPPGKCCGKEKRAARIIVPLSEILPGSGGNISYIHAKDQDKLQKMMAMGVMPGVKIELLQSFPSFLFKVGHSQFAVDRSIADEIFVRISDREKQ